jgi:hypothetical protein
VYAEAESAHPQATRKAVPVAVVVVDERFESARALAADFAVPGARYLALPRDVLDLWHRQLAPICRTRTQAIAGITTERGFFVLRTLAADLRLRVISRSVRGALVSWVIGPK